MSSLLSNVVIYLGSSKRNINKLFLFFSIYPQAFADLTELPESLLTFASHFVDVMCLGFLALIINVVVQAMVRRWRPFKTLISFYIPISLITSPLLMLWWINGYVNVISVLNSFMVFVFTSLAMMLVRSTLRRRTKINPNETGICVCCFSKVN